MKTNQKLNRLIEEAAKSVDQMNFVDMIKRQKNLTKILILVQQEILFMGLFMVTITDTIIYSSIQIN